MLVYLKYYQDLELSLEQKSLLRNGLHNYFSLQKTCGESLLAENREIFYSKVVAGKMLNALSDYDGCLSDIVHSHEIFEALDEILRIGGNRQRIDDENFRQIGFLLMRRSLLLWSSYLAITPWCMIFAA